MTATVTLPTTRDAHDLAAAVVLLLDNREIAPLDILWRFPSGDVFIGPLPDPLAADVNPIGTVVFWSHLSQH